MPPGPSARVEQKRVLGAAGGLLATLLAMSTRAESGPGWLRWSAPPECPTAGDIEERATELFGGVLPADRRLAVATDLRWNGTQWEIAVDVTLDEHHGERRVMVDSCTQAADFVAVAVVLAVDPTSSERLAQENPVIERKAAPPTREEEPKPERVEKARAVDERAPLPRRDDPDVRVTPHVSLVADGAVGVLPGAHFGGAFWAGADVDRLALSLVAAWYPATSTTHERARGPIEFGLIAGRANVAYWFFGPGVRIAPSLSFHGGLIESVEVDSNRPVVREPWLALGIGPQGVVRLGGPVSFFAEGELNVPLVMPTFVLDDGTPVHRPGIGGRLALGGRISLGE